MLRVLALRGPVRHRAVAATGEEVEFDNLAEPGWEVGQLLEAVRTRDAMREALADADAVVITIGLNDLPSNRLDDPCNAAPDYPVVAWDRITKACTDRVTGEYRRDLETVLVEIDTIREGRPYVLVGTSGGGYITAGYAFEHPDQVAGMVFIDTFAPS